jgi:GDSL-like Lipase/Acylhydrolase family
MNSPAAQRPKSRFREWLGRAGLVLLAVVLVLVVLELGLRAATGWLWDWHNLVLGARTVHNATEQSRFMHDALVGYVPRPDGVRPTSTGGEEAPGVPILAVGDSYTYGEEVSDNEAWPAQLQRIKGQRVLNAGVSGYGFDQSVLRAEQIAATRRPSAIVVAFIADDIRRTEMRRQWGAEKPYFDFQGEGLVLRNVPVPPRPDPRTTLTFWQRTLGHSFLFDFVLRRLNLLYDWFGDHIRVHRPGDGERISCLLTERLRELQASSGARVIVLAEYDPMVWRNAEFSAEQRRLAQGLLACARQRGLGTINSFEALANAPGGPQGLYGQWHMNDKGNRLIAGLVADALTQGTPR